MSTEIATQVGSEIATQASGNTKPEAVVTEEKAFKCPKKRAFLLTFNEDATHHCKFAWEYLKKLKNCRYMIACKEINKKGNEHCHLYVNFNNAYAIPSKLINTTKMHIDPAFGSPDQNIAYVKKEGEKYAKKKEQQKTEILGEYGEKPHQGSLTIKELREIKSSDDLPDWKQYNVWKQVKNEHKKTKVSEWHKDIEVFWIQGPSAAGKSQKAVEIMKERGIEEFDEAKHDRNGFWHNIDGTGCCVYDDFRDSHMTASEFINFIDYNIHNLNIKGGSVRNLYHTIIITTVQDIDTIYSNVGDEPRLQWTRRMKVINMYNENN